MSQVIDDMEFSKDHQLRWWIGIDAARILFTPTHTKHIFQSTSFGNNQILSEKSNVPRGNHNRSSNPFGRTMRLDPMPLAPAKRAMDCPSFWPNSHRSLPPKRLPSTQHGETQRETIDSLQELTPTELVDRDLTNGPRHANVIYCVVVPKKFQTHFLLSLAGGL